MNRRRFILATLAAALAPFAARAAGQWGRTAGVAAPMLRPTPRAVSAQVCARCGGPGHAALDPTCPANIETWATVQSAARRGSGPYERADT